jgi:hypothetical protein
MTDQEYSITATLESITAGREPEEYLTIYQINQILHERGFAILMILFSFPMAIPLPYPPGFTTVLGMPLLFYSCMMILGKKNPWLPDFVGRRKIKVSHLNIAIAKMRSFFLFVDRVTKPRLLFMVGSKGEKIIGLVGALCSISVILPIWFGNAIPSLGIMIMSIGLLTFDGVIVLVGILTSIFGLFVAGVVVMLGVTVVKSIIAKILNF